jgi:hypothetical protein
MFHSRGLRDQKQGDKNMRLSRFALIIAFGIPASGCVQIPPAAVDLSRDVSKGISALRDNGNDMVAAWEEIGYRLLDERWAKVYTKAETDFRAKRKIASGVALTAQDQQDVAGLATLYRDAVRKKVQDKAAELRIVINRNAKTTLDANESLTSLLSSAQAALGVQQSALRSVGELIPALPKASSFIDDVLNTVTP